MLVIEKIIGISDIIIKTTVTETLFKGHVNFADKYYIVIHFAFHKYLEYNTIF